MTNTQQANLRIPVRSTPLAIIGMGCRLPGADGLDAYWQMIHQGQCAVRELPPERLDQQMYYDPTVGVRNKTYTKLGAIVDSRELDPARCPDLANNAGKFDITHLIMSQVAADACRHAGLDPLNLPERNAGVYIGHAAGSTLSGDYVYGNYIEEAAQFLREVDLFSGLAPADQERVIAELVQNVRAKTPAISRDMPDLTASMCAGLISKTLGLNGPYMVANSACASSLHALLIGARALQLGQVDMAIVGGASDCKSDTLVLFSQAQALSATGSRCFSKAADGMICSEGYVTLVMKTLERALADGDPIQAVVGAVGVASDGKGRSLWAPRKEGQIEAFRRAYDSGIDMSTLDYIEAHSTATQLGDATEIQSLTEAIGDCLPPGKKIPVTSVKSNVGHSVEAAGIASIIKTTLCMQHGVIPAAINIDELNPNIDWQQAPVYVPQTSIAWPDRNDGGPRRAGVDAFGIGGLNVHVCLESYDPQAARVPAHPATNDDPDDRAIAVVGIGCIFAGCQNRADYLDLLASGRDPKQPAPEDRWRGDLALAPGAPQPYRTLGTRGGYVTGFEYDWRLHKVPPKQIAQADPLQFMLLEAVDEAFIDSGYDKKTFDRKRAGCFVGTDFGGDFSFQLQLGLRLPDTGKLLRESLARLGMTPEQQAEVDAKYGETLLKNWPALIDETGSFSTSTLASRITKTFNLMGPAAALDSGTTSAMTALVTSMNMLLAGDSDMMVCAAGQSRMTLPTFEGMSMAGVLATDSASPGPLDAAAAGYMPGEGVGVVILKRLADARRDGDRIHAIVRGVGMARGNSEAEAMELAIRRSFDSAAPAPADVSVVITDAVGLPHRDEQLAEAIARAYGDFTRREPLQVGSVIGQIGNTEGASAMASLIASTQAVEAGDMPGTFGLSSPVGAIRNRPELLASQSAGSKIAGVTADGRRFGAVTSCAKGLAFHAIIERGSPVPEHERPAMPAAIATPAPVSAPAPAPAQAIVPGPAATARQPRLIEFDATARRRDKMRSAAEGSVPESPSAAQPAPVQPTPTPTVPVVPTAAPPAPTQPIQPSAAAPPASPTPPSTPLAVNVPPQASTNGAGSHGHSAPAASVSSAELQDFLINFVVEQTGYPAEIVELDADLEGDLGIDSIKKAQMFAELGEYFHVTVTEDLQLDDFTTLRHVLDFLAGAKPTEAYRAEK